MMIPVLLTQVKTRDGITLNGIYVPPRHKSQTAIIWIHGLTSTFYFSQKLIEELSSSCRKINIGYFKYNTRGHDIVARGPRGLIGTIFERFEDCALDIDAMILEAKRLGYKNIILAGHSTGANKSAYYTGKTSGKNIKGLILLGAASDISAEIKRIGKHKFHKNLRLAQKLSVQKPFALFSSNGYLFSAKRALSLFTPGRAEDTFPYHDPEAAWKTIRSIRPPLAVIFGSRDECLDRPAQKLIDIFRKNSEQVKSFSGIIIKGADHGFHKKEKELAREIVKWIKQIRPH